VLIIATTLSMKPGVRPNPQGASFDYASANGKIREITLPDGSRVTLDAGSQIRGRFEAQSRTLELVRGRAYFDVKHDASKPFAVTAGSHRIVALGTRFDVDLLIAGLRVALEQGRVAIASSTKGAKQVVLEPGQQFVEGNETAAVRTLDSAEASNWRRGLIDIDDLPLSAAAAEINRYTTLPIVIRDPNVARLHVTGQFRAGDAERFASVVAEIHPVRVVRRQTEIEIAPRR
jgi:transmembrane sensor